MKVKNTIEDLNMLLFEQFERLADPDTVTQENIALEVNRTEMMCEIAGALLENGKLQLQAAKYREQGIKEDKDRPIPMMLEVRENDVTKKEK